MQERASRATGGTFPTTGTGTGTGTGTPATPIVASYRYRSHFTDPIRTKKWAELRKS